MDSIRMGTAGSGLGRIVAALVLLLAVSAPAWAQQEETQQEETQQEELHWSEVCPSKWEESPASAYCSEEIISRTGASTDGSTGDCTIKTASCSIDVTIGRKSVTFRFSLFREQFTPDETASLDLCFEANSAALHGYYVSLNSPCPASKIDSSTAQSDGLPAT